MLFPFTIDHSPLTMLKFAVRNLFKRKTFTAINIIGLTVGLTSFILIALYIFDEFTFDRFHKNAANIYRVVETRTSAEGKPLKRAGTGYQVSASATKGFPEIQDVARMSTYSRANVVSAENKSIVFYENFTVASPGILSMFSFPVIHGERGSALKEPNSVVITEETAQKFFGKTDAIGKTLLMWGTEPYKVTAVLKNFPPNSSISFNLVVSESSFDKNVEATKFLETDWNSGAFTTYLLVKNNTNIAALNKKLDNLVAANAKEEAGVTSQINLQPLKDIHFYSTDIEGDSGRKGDISYIYVFLIVACFIIFIACINYMNLSTARFTHRGKEIAIRKVSGASRTTLVKQFLAEALVVTVISVVLSIVLVNLFLPAFNSFTAKTLTVNMNTDYRIWLGITAVVAIVTLLAGLYPALFQSGLNPLSLLKGKIQLGKGNISLRRSLVVFQFMISIVLIAATIIIYEQMQYVNNKDMGFDKEKLVVIDINSGDIRSGASTIKDELRKLTQVKSVAVTSRVPGEWKTIPSVTVNADKSNPAKGTDMYFFGVDDQFLSTYNIKLVDGRNFFPSATADSASVLINETAAKQFGITKALGQPITILSAKFAGDNRSMLEKPFTANVVGIVKDFNFQSLHEPLAPMVIGFQNNPVHAIDYFTVKITGSDVATTVNKMKNILHGMDQQNLFEYHFLDKQWDLLYREDTIRQTIFLIVALLAIFIAALGLLGLTIYAAEQRVKEIGIRKVLGASVSGIVLMLSKDFLKLVLIAAVIAIPISWFFMHKWLEDFAYRINLSWTVFILAALVAIIIAMVTICLQVVRAAVANPVESLRSE